jgi:hypothetical protein
MSVIINQLPYQFPSWNSLKNFLENRNLLKDGWFNVVFDVQKVNEKSEVNEYSYHLDFIKARCFDEFNSLKINKDDVLWICRVSYNFVNSESEREILRKFELLHSIYTDS